MTAREFAIQHHADQQYGDRPYVAHLDEVVQILSDFGYADLQDVGYLHDVLEDTPATEADLLNLFGPFVTEAVQVCTDAEGPNRRARKAATYQRVLASRKAPSAAILAGLAVKVADRIANLQNCHRDRSPLLQMYLKEDPAFRQTYQDPAHATLWAKYDALCRPSYAWTFREDS